MLPLTPVHALYKHPILFQTLDLGGLPLLLFVFNLFCWMTVEMLMRLWRRAGIKKYLIAQLALAACVTGYGGFRMVDLQSKEQRADDHQKIEITSIQPNLPVKKFGQALFVKPEDLNNDLTTVLKLTKDAIEAYPETDLLVWPELPIVLPCSRASDEQKKIQKMITQSGMQLIHICEQELPRHGGTTYHNTASHIRAVGKPGSMYSKKRLVPFGEYLPFEEEIPFLRKLFKNTRYYVPGNINTLFDVSDGKTIIPAICYELTFSNHIRDFALAGGNIILNMSNEAYFGRTAASVIALSIGIFRAVEYRMPLVRVTNSGNGCFVKPTGEIVANTLTLLFKKATISTSIFVPDEVSLYLSLGDSFLWVMSFAFCFFVIPIGLSFRTKT
ncbi:MAG: apolipoprotein N-acyltransferase [Proteobacteria bacterium]|nr:apolipoprotein N-acyltransferase [Pseudomonadota bacterium]